MPRVAEAKIARGKQTRVANHGFKGGFILASGSMSSNQSGEDDIRSALIEADFVDCMVALPGQLFYSTQIPVCFWFTGKNKTLDSENDARLFDGETELNLVA
ncbi:MAG: N-6 DNA methylase [Verrucomicrobiales bacterium]|nr:N-6 DNA methylase [Verrucomicrobiales bacterium]